jgi:hypothetical protein
VKKRTLAATPRRQTLTKESEMKLQKRILLIIAAIVTTLGVSNAQVKQNISEEKLTDLLGRIDVSTEHFVKSADKAMDKAGYDGSPREDELNTILKNLKSSTNTLRNDHSSENAKTDFITVVHYGVQIENFLKKYPLDGVQEEWAALRSDLGELTTGFGITWEQGHAIGAPVGMVDVKNLCQHLEDVADHWKEALDSALDNSKLNGTKTEDEYNQYVKEFRDATNTLQDHYNGDQAKDDAKEVLTRGKRIDDFMRKHPLTSNVQDMWVPVRTDLQRLAKFYALGWNWQ